MFDRFQKRSYELENIDKGTYTPAEYEGSLVELRRVNRLLGDARVMRQTLLTEIQRESIRKFSVLDVGAGSGYLLRVIARWARTRHCQTTLVGVELNERSSQAILEESTEYAELTAVRADGLRLPFSDHVFDYAISSLALHHFDDAGAIHILREMSRVASRGIFVIDLHRHPIAYFFYTTAGRIILHNRLLREDGALSILRSFRPNELYQLAQRAGLDDIRVERHFPYRLVLRARRRLAEFAPSARSVGPEVHLSNDIRRTA